MTDPMLKIVEKQNLKSAQFSVSFERDGLIAENRDIALFCLRSGDEVTAEIRRLCRSSHKHPIIVSFRSSSLLSIHTPSLWPGKILSSRFIDRAEAEEILALPFEIGLENFLLRFEDYCEKKSLQGLFVQKFRKAMDILEKKWRNVESGDRRTLSQIFLNRLLFLFFIQSAGALDGRKLYIVEEMHRRSSRHLYREFFETLFFRCLNKDVATREEDVRSFGDIPFLNGGLFRQSREEENNPERDLDNDTLFSVAEMLSIPFRFDMAEEMTAPDRLDPMMLGHIFEKLMPKDRRSRTGSYYSPRPLTQRLCADALRAFLMSKVRASEASHAMHAPSRLSPESAEKIDKLLSEITILDPCAGSGAFLLTAFEMLFDIRSALAKIMQKELSAPALATHIVTHNLFGVDILPEAVKICELRLWLAVASKNSGIYEPLPNLDSNVEIGNSLLGMYECCSEKAREAEKTRLLYAQSHGEEKDRIKGEMRRMRNELAIEENMRELAIKEEIAAEVKRILDSPQLFEDRRTDNAAMRKRFIRISEQCDELRRLIESLKRGENASYFSYASHFPAQMQSGGFDIIVANPPWMPCHRLDANELQKIKKIYALATATGKGARFAELAGVFVERAYDLVKRDGIIAVLLPQKLFNVRSYGNVRNFVRYHTELLQSYDWSDSGRRYFSAGNYPAAWLMAKRKAYLPAVNRDVGNCPAIGSRFCIRRGLVTGNNDIFIPRKTVELDDVCVLGDFGTYGTGKIEKSLLFPVIRGSDISEFRCNIDHRMIVTHDLNDRRGEQLPCMSDLPENARHWFRKNAQCLINRRGYSRKRAIWQLFSLKSDIMRHKVVWRDIGTKIEACFVESGVALPLNTVYYIPVSDREQGYLLAALLNCERIRKLSREKAPCALNGYRRFFSYVIADLPWLPHCMTDKQKNRVIALSESLHAGDSEVCKSKIDRIFDEAEIKPCVNILL